jgi:hypothetical protein
MTLSATGDFGIGGIVCARAAKPATAEGRDAQAMLKGWDADMRMDAAAPLVFSAWYRELTRLVYGDELGQYEGRVKQARELAEMAAEYGEFRVYVVEVCQSCGWNHLATSYVLGTGEPAVRRRRRARTSQ